MVTIDLRKAKENCFALVEVRGAISCRILKSMDKNCGTCGCPFYKPIDCKSWVRLESGRNMIVIPPEEYYRRRQECLEG